MSNSSGQLPGNKKKVAWWLSRFALHLYAHLTRFVGSITLTVVKSRFQFRCSTPSSKLKDGVSAISDETRLLRDALIGLGGRPTREIRSEPT